MNTTSSNTADKGGSFFVTQPTGAVNAVVQRSQKESAERNSLNRSGKSAERFSRNAERAGSGKKLHSHKFIHHFIDGNRCIMKVTRSNIIKLRWRWRPDETLVEEYRTWRMLVKLGTRHTRCAVISLKVGRGCGA